MRQAPVSETADLPFSSLVHRLGETPARLRAVLTHWTDPADPHVRTIRMAQLQLAARNGDASLRQLPLVGLTSVIVFGCWAPIWPLIGWFVAMVLTAYWERIVLRPLVSGTVPLSELGPASWRYFFVNCGQMIVYVAVAPIAWMPNEPMLQALILMMLGVSMASVTSITGASRIIFLSDILPAAATAIVLPVAMGGLTGAPLSLSAIVFSALMIDNAKGAYRLAFDALTLNDQNEALIRRLRASDRAKSEFLANMSHELRTPLNAILGFSEIMKDEVLGPMQNRLYRSYAGDIHTSGQHLLGLVNDILDLAKIEAGRVELADDIFAATSLADTAINLFRMQADQSNIRLVKNVDPQIELRWDLRAAKQILLNLMSNALKFTPSGGTVTLSIRCEPSGGATIIVEDTGCGIAPEFYDKIFESFGQGRHDIASDHKSSGLGLAIVKGLVEAHGAEIKLTSAVGEGTALTILVPPGRVELRPLLAAA